MNIEDLQHVLVDELGAAEEDGEYTLPDDKEVTALLKTGADLMHVVKLKIVAFDSNSTTLVTRDAEYYVAPEDIFALKLESSRFQRGEARPGFRVE